MSDTDDDDASLDVHIVEGGVVDLERWGVEETEVGNERDRVLIPELPVEVGNSLDVGEIAPSTTGQLIWNKITIKTTNSRAETREAIPH